MRKDMYKVIVERPRRGSTRRDAKRTPSHYMDEDYADTLPTGKIGMRRLVTQACGWNRKELNENLQPLVRFLKSKLGQHWDDVYSEICENINLNSTVRRHIRQHIDQMVDLNVFVKNDTVYNSRGYKLMSDDFYVLDGILCINEHKNRWKPEKKEQPYITINNRHYAKINDLWYEIKVHQREKREYMTYSYFEKKMVMVYNYPQVTCCLNGVLGAQNDLKYVRTWYATKLKQLNTKEIKELNVA